MSWLHGVCDCCGEPVLPCSGLCSLGAVALTLAGVQLCPSPGVRNDGGVTITENWGAAPNGTHVLRTCNNDPCRVAVPLGGATCSAAGNFVPVIVSGWGGFCPPPVQPVACDNRVPHGTTAYASVTLAAALGGARVLASSILIQTTVTGTLTGPGVNGSWTTTRQVFNTGGVHLVKNPVSGAFITAAEFCSGIRAYVFGLTGAPAQNACQWQVGNPLSQGHQIVQTTATEVSLIRL